MPPTSPGPRMAMSREMTGAVSGAPGTATVLSASSTWSVAWPSGPASGSVPSVSGWSISAATPRRSQPMNVYSDKLGLREHVDGLAARFALCAQLLGVRAREQRAVGGQRARDGDGEALLQRAVGLGLPAAPRRLRAGRRADRPARMELLEAGGRARPGLRAPLGVEDQRLVGDRHLEHVVGLQRVAV